MKNAKASILSRRLLIGAAAGLLLLAAAVFALWQTRAGIAERIIADALAARGLAPASFRVSMLGLRSIEVADLAIGPAGGAATKGTPPPDIAASRITVTYRIGELLSGRVQSIEVAGLRVNARIDERGFSLGAADGLLHQAGAGGGAAALPDIHVVDAAILLATPQGPLELGGNLDLSQVAAAAPIDIAVPALRLVDRASPIRFEPIDIAGKINFDGRALTLAADGRSASPKASGAELAKISGQYDLSAASGAVRVTGSLAFTPGKLEPQILFPVLKGLMTNVQGKASYQADISIARGALRSSGEVSLAGIGFDAYSASFAGLTGTVRLASLAPLRTRGPQALSVGLVQAGIPLKDGRVAFEIGRSALPRLIEAKWPFADGQLTLTSAQGADNEFDLVVENADVASLLTLADVPGLSGTGTISGKVPVVLENGNPMIRHGALEAAKGGVIAYKSASADAAAGNEQTKLLTDALKDFHYTELSGTLDGNANGELQFHLRLRGANPAVYSGYPIILNVNLQGSLADLLRHGTVGLRPMELIRGEIAPTKKAKP